MKLYITTGRDTEATIEITVHSPHAEPREPSSQELLLITHELRKSFQHDSPTSHVHTTSQLDDITY
jgi:hypothetical protein